MSSLNKPVNNLLSFGSIHTILKNVLKTPYNSYVYEKKDKKGDFLYAPITNSYEGIMGLFTCEIHSFLQEINKSSNYHSRIANHTVSRRSTGEWIVVPAIREIRDVISADVIANQTIHIKKIVELSNRFNAVSSCKGHSLFEEFRDGISENDLRCEERNHLKESTRQWNACKKLHDPLTTIFNSMCPDDHPYQWLYLLLADKYFDDSGLKEEFTYKFLAILLILSLDIHDEIFDPQQTLPVFKKSVCDFINKSDNIVIKKPTGMIEAKIKENQELEGIVKEFETLIAKIGDMLAEYDQFSLESTEIESEIKKMLNIVDRKQQIFNLATVQGKAKELEQLRTLYGQQSSHLQSLSIQFTQSRSN